LYLKQRRLGKNFNESMTKFFDGNFTEQLSDRSKRQLKGLSLNATQLTPAKSDRLKFLMASLAKMQAFRDASVRVVHAYSHHEWKHDFTFESLPCGKQGYMHGKGGTIRRGDYVVVESNNLNTVRYQVVEIAYEPTSSSLWTALLQLCSEVTNDRYAWMRPIDEPCILKP
jgi:hypothetical protein